MKKVTFSVDPLTAFKADSLKGSKFDIVDFK
jgi:hypothetical protein